MRAVAVLLILLGACTSAPKQQEILDQVEGATMTRTQLRALMFNYMARFAEQVARSANQIADRSSDPEIRRSALTWKINSVAVMQVTCSHTDPAAAMLAAWAFVAGMREFFETGHGAELFGDQQALATQTSVDLESEVAQIHAMLTGPGDAPEAHDLVYSHVEKYPFEDLHFTSWRSDTPLISMLSETDLDVFSVAASLEDRTAHLAAVMRFYAYLLPNQMRWHAELLTGDLLKRDKLEGLTHNLATMADDLRAMGEFVGTATQMLTAQREAAVQALVDAFDRERIAITTAIDRQRVAALAAITEERKIVLAHIDELVDRENEIVPEIAAKAFDHFWWRGVQVLAGFALVGGLLALLAMKLLMKRKKA